MLFFVLVFAALSFALFSIAYVFPVFMVLLNSFKLNTFVKTDTFELENGDISAEQFCIELGSLCNREISHKEAKHAWMGFIASVHEDFLEYLQLLRPHCKLGVLSNTNPFIQSWAVTSEFSKKGKPLGDYFDNLFFSYRMNASKPGEEIYKKMLLEGNMKAEETLFIDDSEKNIETARKLGICTLKVENGEDWRPMLERILSVNR